MRPTSDPSGLRPLWAVIDEAAGALESAGLAEPRREARRLLAHALGMDQTMLLRERDRMIDPNAVAPLLRRRLAREPLAFILGRQDFWTLSLATAPVTLIPRADSETLIEAAIDLFPARDVATILDLGTGTGCLLLAALSVFPAAFGVGVDLQPGAAVLAARNAVANNLGARAAFLCGHWGEALSAQFDLILCNPPYVRSNEMADLMPEIAFYEPASALDGGPDGLDAYRLVIRFMPSLLSARGVAILELGAGQADDVTALAGEFGLVRAGLRADLAGIPRAVSLRRAVP